MESIYSLPAGTLLQGNAYRYRIERVLGQGSFGITYLATGYVTVQGPLGNVETQVPVAIKEFFMQELSSRDATGSLESTSDHSIVSKYARKFSVEARNLSRIKHPGIVSVLDFIDANNTFYYVMEYIEGSSLDEYVCSRGGLPEQEALDGIRQIGAALSYMHAHKMLHLDLKPKNVMRRADGRLLLIDFGLSKQYDGKGEPESSTTIGLGTPGYAPIEQADAQTGREYAPTLDVYALGATLFKMLTGETPPKASDIINFGFPFDKLSGRGVSELTVKAVEGAMQFRRADRIPTVEDFLAMLPGGSDEERTAVMEPGRRVARPANPTGQKGSGKKAQAAPGGKKAFVGDSAGRGSVKKLAVAAGIVLSVAGIGAAFLFFPFGKGSHQEVVPAPAEIVPMPAEVMAPDTMLRDSVCKGSLRDTAKTEPHPRPTVSGKIHRRNGVHAAKSTATGSESGVIRKHKAVRSEEPSEGGTLQSGPKKKKWKEKFKKLFRKKKTDGEAE